MAESRGPIGRLIDGAKRLVRIVKVPLESRIGPLRDHLRHHRVRRSLPTIRNAIATVEARWDIEAHRSSLDARAMENRPILVLSAGWRSGSTMLQRLVMSERRALVWGEPYDKACYVQALAESLRQFTDEYPPDHYFLSHRVEADDPVGGREPSEDDPLWGRWIANLYPDPLGLYRAHRAFFERLFVAPARRAGYPRWGLKEVRLSADEAFYLRWLFPAARTLLLIRNPYAAYRSYRVFPRWYDRWPETPVMTAAQFGRMWRRLATSFLDHVRDLDAKLVRFEDVAGADPPLEELSAYLGFPVSERALERRVTGRGKGSLPQVPRSEVRRLRRAVGPVAEELGYGPP